MNLLDKGFFPAEVDDIFLSRQRVYILSILCSLSSSNKSFYSCSSEHFEHIIFRTFGTFYFSKLYRKNIEAFYDDIFGFFHGEE